jgi:phosphotriesterase-related protein
VAEVQTVLGPVDTADLGRVLMHEHVVVVDPEIQSNFPGRWEDGRWEEEPGIATAAEELRTLKAAGFDTIADVSIYPMGRNVERVREIARRCGINILVTTGLYMFDKVPVQFEALRWENGVDPLVTLFVRDVMEGSGATGIRSALIKCTTDRPGLTAGTERGLRAAARAHRLTGVPITTHSKATLLGGFEQQRILAEEGVDLTRVIIGHCGETTDVDYLEVIAGRGSYLGMDHFGFDTMLPWMERFGIDDVVSFEDRVATVVELCRRGHAEQIVLSHDYAAFLDWVPPDIRQTLPRYNYLHIARDVLPALRERGVTEDQIDAMLVQNPRRIFERQEPY